jgi:hypothetical protein
VGYHAPGHELGPVATLGGRIPRRRLDLREAAEVLGLSVDAVRKRVKREALESEKGPDGRVYVFLDDDQESVTPRSDTDRLISTLEEQLRLEREAHAEARRLLAAALERIPAIEPPESPETPSEPVPGPQTPPQAETPPERVPWWRRVLGQRS